MSATDNFGFHIVGGEKAPFIGYVSAPDKTVVSPRAMVMGSKNVYKKISGNIAVRPGLKRRGTANDTVAGVLSAFVWSTSLATTRPLRVANGKLQVESDILVADTYVWYDLQTGLTLTDYVFDTVWDNTLKKDFLTFVRGDTNLFRWDGGIGVTSSYTVNTVVLTSAAAQLGFKTSGDTVTINGTTYTYTGISSATLTGVTPNPSAEPVGSVVVSGITTNASTPAATFTNDFVKTIGNRVHVGSYTSRLIYISDDSSYIDFTVPTPRIPGSPEILTLDSLGKGIGVRQGEAHIFGGVGDLYIISYSPVTVGSTLTEQTRVDKKSLASLEGAYNHNFITSVGDDLIWLSQAQEVKMFGTFRNLSSPVFPTISDQIKSDLQAEDFTGGAISAIGEFVYFTAPNNGNVWLYQTHVRVTSLGNVSTERVWHPPFVWNLSRIVAIDGVEYGHSNANPQVYQMWDTNQWSDDSPSDEQLPYSCVVAMAYRNSGDRFGLLGVNKMYFEGYMTRGSEVNSAIAYDYQGSTGLVTRVVNSNATPATFFEGNVGVSLGDSSLGDNPLGDGVTDDTIDNLPKFRAVCSVGIKDSFEYQLRVYSQQAGARWELICLGANHTASTRNATFIGV